MVNNLIRDIFEAGLFRGEVRYYEAMSAHTSLKIGGVVEIMAFPEDPLSLKNILLAAAKENIRVLIIGAGTNLLVGEKDMKLIAVSMREFKKIELTKDSDEDTAVLYVGAGTTLQGLLNFAQKNGYSGIEALAGIPGSFGGAVYMNAGSFETEINDVIESVAIMNVQGEISIIEKNKLNFSYRSSNLPEGAIILSANIILRKGDPDEVTKRAKEFLKRKKVSQPLGVLSAGCVFKNPEGDSAGRLIDIAGCKGMRKGDVEVSNIHANYFINRGMATFSDFISLMEDVRMKVKQSSGITLEPEIKIIDGAKQSV